LPRLLLIRPAFGAGRNGGAQEPLVFALLTALTPPSFSITLVDEHVESLPADLEADLVAMTVETYSARRAYQIAAPFRARGIPVVMGGFHPTLLPDEVSQYADAVVVGDAEPVWPRLLADFAVGTLQPVYHADSSAPLENLRLDRRVFAGISYAPIFGIQAGRGCRYHCDFCSIHAMYGRSVRTRPIPEIIRELEEAGKRLVFFVDDNLFPNRAYALALFRALIPLKLKWTCQISIDITADGELLSLMARSGCILVLIGFESLHEENLLQMRKSWNQKSGGFDLAITRLRDQGIMVYGTFVFGYDADTPDSFATTLEFALRSKMCIANFNPLTPTPGTPLFERLQRERRLLHEHWWLDPSYRYGESTFHPRGMTPDQLADGCQQARRDFHAWSSIFQRTLDRKANASSFRKLGLHLLVNTLSRKEVFRKERIPLAGPEPLPGESLQS
jgi:radical SAM superfamily enzyme YgiQ (UPF0313 family)